LRDAWEPSAGAVPTRQHLVVPAGERRRVATTLTPTRRGDRDAVRVTVRSIGPLGLAARQGRRAVPARVRVLPPFGSRRHLPARLARLRELDGRRAVQVRGQGTEFDSLREYVPGDDVRSLDWRASARSTDLVVRTWRPERDRHVLVVLDTGRSAASRVGDAPRLDAALDTALLLAALASRGGDRVDLLALDREVRASVQGATARDVLPALVTAMAPLEARLVETDMRLVASTVLARAGRRSLVVLVTGLDESAIAEGLEPVLPALLRRHTLLVAAVADPELAVLAAGRGDAEAVYTAAAAETARAARRRVVERLTRRGVEVVDAGPDDLPPAVADRYLALKAAGRL
ncbi:MAG: lipoprotein, partial [Actinomycetospora sp.]|nr:lipoprotein [Actinomycetospora sp.]